jgi:uncharacterized DUF497 family protein
MKILPSPLSFVWDEGNLLKNLEKHKVSVPEAEEMFINEPFTVSSDKIHSTLQEKRFQALGHTKANRKLFAAFTIRDRKIRIISIRDMSKKEKIAYEQLENNS